MFTLPIYNIEADKVDKINLETTVFDGKVNSDLIYQTVLMYRANQRKGLASTKTRGEVSGGGRKPWRQKGTGRARVGSIRSPLWKGGGVVFGPHPRSYSYSLPNKIKIQALRSCLNAKLKENSIIVLDQINIGSPKTKDFIMILSRLETLLPMRKKKNLLLLLDKIDKDLRLAANNINYLDINLAKNINALQVLRARELIITKEALKQLTDRIKKGLNSPKGPKASR